MQVPDEIYAHLCAFPTLTKHKPEHAINALGALIDGAWDRRDLIGTDLAIRLGTALLETDHYSRLSPELWPHLHYDLANAWANKALLTPDSDERAWDWHAEPLEQQILHFRTALARQPDDQLRCRVLTNLANALDRVGRFVESLELYDRAISLEPKYGMPRGNRGIAIRAYAECVPDPGHAHVLLHFSSESLEQAITLAVDDDAARQDMAAALRGVRASLHECKPIEWNEEPLGASEDDRAYRSWVLGERLFLNPINDVAKLSSAARDPITPVSIVTGVGEGPYLFSFFNALKQEFVSARFLLFQGIHRAGVHFSDRHVKLTDAKDDAVHRLGIEEVKIAFRVAYSLLDKVAVFLNEYLKLGIAIHQVSFRDLWYAEKKESGRRLLRPQFTKRPNLALRGLFWISKDLAEQRDDHRAVIAPDAQDLVQIRNALEHKHLRVTGGVEPPPGRPSNYPDPLARVVGHEDFERKTIRILKHARAALIQLACAVAIEERARAKEKKSQALPMLLPDREDEKKHR